MNSLKTFSHFIFIKVKTYCFCFVFLRFLSAVGRYFREKKVKLQNFKLLNFIKLSCKANGDDVR